MIVRRILTMLISLMLVCALVAGPALASAMTGHPTAAMHQGSGQACDKASPGKVLPGACTSSTVCTVQTGVPAALVLLPIPLSQSAQLHWWTIRTGGGTAVPPELGPPRLTT